MLDRLFGNDDRDRERSEDGTMDREEMVRERMRADGVSEDEARRLVLSEEELEVGKREVRAGEVAIDKDVETRHVRENVPLRQEEVEIERRPVTDGFSARGSIGEDEEIRIPLTEERAVVEKRTVPTEEIVVRKRNVVENESVEADLRRERAEVRPSGDVRMSDDREDLR